MVRSSEIPCRIFNVIFLEISNHYNNGKVLPYLLPSVGPGAHPGVQVVSAQVTLKVIPGSRLQLLSARPKCSKGLHSNKRSKNTAIGARICGKNTKKIF